VVRAGLDAGLVLEAVSEYDFVLGERFLPPMTEESPDRFVLSGSSHPLSLSFVFRKARGPAADER
jgi:hypothetical protein